MTLIVAVVIIAILIVFTFALTLVAYSLYSSQNKNLSSMKCAEAANTLSTSLADELTFMDDSKDRFPEFDSYLYMYIRYNLFHSDKTWPYYYPKKAGHGQSEAFRKFELKYNTKKTLSNPDGSPYEKVNTDETKSTVPVEEVEGLPGKTVVCIYWELPGDADEAALTGTKPIGGTKLTIEVTCEAASQTYTAKKELTLDISNYGTGVKDLSRQKAIKDAESNTMVNPYPFSYQTETNPNDMWIWTEME